MEKLTEIKDSKNEEGQKETKSFANGPFRFKGSEQFLVMYS